MFTLGAMSSWHNDWCRESIYPGNIAELADKMGAGVISVSASSWRAVISPHIIQPVQMTLLISMQPIWGITISVTSRCECDIVPSVHAVWHSDNTISCWLFTPLNMSNFSETVHSITVPDTWVVPIRGHGAVNKGDFFPKQGVYAKLEFHFSRG